MVQYYKPATILELGTSLGITTSYLSLAAPKAEVITMEGAHAVASVASASFLNLKLDNIKIVEGNFDNTVPELIQKKRHLILFFWMAITGINQR